MKQGLLPRDLIEMEVGKLLFYVLRIYDRSMYSMIERGAPALGSEPSQVQSKYLIRVSGFISSAL